MRGILIWTLPAFVLTATPVAAQFNAPIGGNTTAAAVDAGDLESPNAVFDVIRETRRCIDVLVGIGAGWNYGVDVRRNLQCGRGGGAFFTDWLAVPPLGSGTLH